MNILLYSSEGLEYFESVRAKSMIVIELIPSKGSGVILIFYLFLFLASGGYLPFLAH